MIQLKESDRPTIEAYISAEPEMNLFFYGDLHNFNIGDGPVRIYALPGDTGWDALMLRFFDDFVVYSPDPGYDAGAVGAFLRQQEEVGCISGKLECVAPLAPFFPAKTLEPTYMSRCNTPPAACPLPAGVTTRRMGAKDVEELLDLLEEIEEFKSNPADGSRRSKQRQSMLANLEKGSLWYGVYEGERLVATAQTSADNDQSAMVVGVATRPGCRGKGYASAVVSELCRSAFAAGRKFLCLFYTTLPPGASTAALALRNWDSTLCCRTEAVNQPQTPPGHLHVPAGFVMDQRLIR